MKLCLQRGHLSANASAHDRWAFSSPGTRYGRSTREQYGMGLIEVMVALFLLMLVLGPTLFFLIGGMNLQADNRFRVAATSLVDKQLSHFESSFLQWFPEAGAGPHGNLTNPPVCNAFSGTTFSGATNGCGVFNPSAFLPQSQRIGRITYKLSYSESWVSSTPNNALGCAVTPTGPFPPAMIRVQVTSSWLLSGKTQSVTSSTYVPVPLEYYNISDGYIAVHDRAANVSVGAPPVPVYVFGLGGLYISQLDGNGCAFFINLPVNPNTGQATYEVATGGFYRLVTVCAGHTTPVPFASGGGTVGGGCGSVSGKGAAQGQLTLNPKVLKYLLQPLNTTSPSQTVTATNTGTWPVAIYNVSISGAQANNFNVTSDGCANQVLMPNASCTFAVDFAPTDIQNLYIYIASVSVTSDAANGTQTVSLYGTIPGCYSPTVLKYHPIGYWKLNDTGGRTAQDFSGNNYTGSLHGGVTEGYNPGPILCNPNDTAMQMNGTNGEVTTPINNFIAGQMTIEAWFKINSWPNSPNPCCGNARIVSNDHTDNTGQTYGFELGVNYGGRSGFFWVGNGTTAVNASWSLSSPLVLGQWYFYAGTYNGSTVNAYLDGQLVASEGWNNQAVAAAPYPVSIGYDPAYNGDYLQGDVAQVALFSGALTQSDLQLEYSTASKTSTGSLSSARIQQANSIGAYSNYCYSNLVSNGMMPSFYWRLDDQNNNISNGGNGNGPVFFNSSPRVGGSQLPRTPYNNNNWSSNYGYGVGGLSNSYYSPVGCNPFENALNFSALPGYAAWNSSWGVATSAEQPNPNNFSIEAWFKTNMTGGIVGFGNAQTGASSDYDRMLWVGPSGHLHFGVWIGSASILSSNAPVNNGQWHFVVASIGPSGMHLYVDGVQVASNGTTQGQQGYSGWWRIGELPGPCWPDTSGCSSLMPFVGKISQVAIFPYQVTTQMVQLQYTQAAPPEIVPSISWGGVAGQITGQGPNVTWSFNWPYTGMSGWCQSWDAPSTSGSPCFTTNSGWLSTNGLSPGIHEVYLTFYWPNGYRAVVESPPVTIPPGW